MGTTTFVSGAPADPRTDLKPTPGAASADSPLLPPLDAEWLEADGLGGFASGTASGVRTRRYHALLLAAATPPTGRVVLVNGVEVRATTPRGSYALTSHRYAPDVVHPDGASRLVAFSHEPWPTWRYRLEDGVEIEMDLFAEADVPGVVLTWRVVAGLPDEVRLEVRPLLSGRDVHALHHENGTFRFEAAVSDDTVTWRPYDAHPAIVARSTGVYVQDPVWYRQFLYAEERARGLDDVEDLASPGTFAFDLSRRPATVTFSTSAEAWRDPDAARVRERSRRRRFPTPLHRGGDAYLVRRGKGRTIVAGYPWFTDWGRDTFIALRGLCLAAGRLDDARDILAEWAGVVSEGMLPNRFAESDAPPEYNSVDASLWYAIAVHDYLRRAAAARRPVPAAEAGRLRDAVTAIVAGYARGTRYGIRMDDDGLLASGEAGVQLTWMDAKVGEWVVTPRTGKAVEIQALWLNALRIASVWDAGWAGVGERARRSFEARFWNRDRGCLYDVVDVDHQPGVVDARMRPNQIFAVGGLPFPVLDGDRARLVVDAVEEELVTPMGLRTLGRGDPGYAPRYEGGVRERDGAYHRGTVWPWLMGPFVEAWRRVRGDTSEARRESHRRFLAPLLDHMNRAGLGHVSEIADAEPPHTPRGCPFQAWSLGELLRVTEPEP